MARYKGDKEHEQGHLLETRERAINTQTAGQRSASHQATVVARHTDAELDFEIRIYSQSGDFGTYIQREHVGPYSRLRMPHLLCNASAMTLMVSPRQH